MASTLKLVASRFTKNLLTRELKARCQSLTSLRYANTNQSPGVVESVDRDPAPYFFDSKVQEILTKITGLDLEKIFSPQQMKPTEPTYKFATAEELQKMIEDSKKRAVTKLQLTPVMKEREPITTVLSRDPELKEFENCTLVFTDITYGISDRKRLIVARDTDGTLRHANWDERHRMNHIFFPRPGRKLTMPKMFEDEHLEKVINEKQYKFILDRACVQFEPDDPNYIRVTKSVYAHIHAENAYHDLRSTRHFGAMAFHFAFHNKIDGLLLDMIKRELLEYAASYVKLFFILHPRFTEVTVNPSDQFEYIRAYANKSSKRNDIELALKSYQDLQQQKEKTEMDIKRAHGYSN